MTEILVCISLSISSFSQNVGIGTSTPIHQLEVVSSPTTSTNATIYSTNTGNTGNAVLGVSNNAATWGIRGLSGTGTGVQGYTSVGYAMAGVSLGGTAVYAQSGTGYGLISSGKLKLSGGNTTPSNGGGVLTSDAAGNATWKRSNLAFFANTAANAIGETSTKVEFSCEGYDTQNNFVNYTGSVNAGSSVFTAPVAGVYHFSSALLFEKSGFPSASIYMLSGTIRLVKNGSLITYNYAPSISHLNAGSNFSCYVYLYIDADVHLNATDKVWVEAFNNQNGDHVPAAVPLSNISYNCRFNGELVFAD